MARGDMWFEGVEPDDALEYLSLEPPQIPIELHDRILDVGTEVLAASDEPDAEGKFWGGFVTGVRAFIVMRQAVWAERSALDEHETSPVKTIAAKLGVSTADVAAIVYPAETLGEWDDSQEPIRDVDPTFAGARSATMTPDDDDEHPRSTAVGAG